MSDPSITRVGFIGLGDQGGPMARAVAEGGFELHVWARRPASLEAVQGVPHTVSAEPAQLAGVTDILLLCLKDDRDVVDLLDGGLQQGLRRGGVVVNHGTGEPASNRQLDERLRALGVAFLDAPVSGGRHAAESKTLTTMVGGDEKVFRRIEPVLQSFSAKVARLGPVGAGQTAKLLNNALTMTNLKNAVDVFELATALGLDLGQLQDVVLSSSGGSRVLAAVGCDISAAIAPHLQGLMRKDIEHFARAMADAGLDASALRQRGLAGADGLAALVGSVRPA